MNARRTAVAAVVVLLGLSGCEKVTRTVSSSVSPCFKVLPEAHAAVGKQGTFVDVVRVRGRAPTTAPAPKTPTTTATTTVTGVPRPPRDVCVVAYRGTFDPTKIPSLTGINRTGKYAIVVVSVRTQKVRSVVLTDRLPRPLHAH